MDVILQEDSQAEDSEDLSEEQEQWLKERMAAPTWGRPYKAWTDRQEGRS